MTIRFVTGTDTGVGKTVAAAALARSARAAGKTVAYFKPVQTGVGPDDPGDAGFVGSVAAVPAHEGTRFRPPLAPAVAAALDGEKVDVDALRNQAIELARECDELIVEGAGGLLVPLDARYGMADFAASLDADLVVVARPGLGTLNHTALTLEAARRRGMDPAVIVSNWPAAPGRTESTNLDLLSEMAPVIGVVPSIDGLDVATGAAPEPPTLLRWELMGAAR